MSTGERWAAGGDLRAAVARVGLVAAWVAASVLTAWATWNYVTLGGVGMDSHAYWAATHAAHPYGGVVGSWGAYLYSPLFLQALRPFGMLPWPMFFVAFAAVNAVAQWWLVKPLAWQWRVPVLLIGWTELLTGNVWSLLAVALALGVRRPGWLAFPLLTKVTPGGVGFVWHVARGDWRRVLMGGAVMAALVVVSFATEPHLWVEWVRMLAAQPSHASQQIRLVAGVALAVVAARTDRPWLLAVAYWLATPTAGLYMLQPMIVLAAAIRLSSSRSVETPSAVPVAVGTAA